MAGHGSAPQAKWAISELYESYRSPVYAFVQRQGFSPDEAEDLTQGFFTRWLEKDCLSRVDPSLGPFHSWLLTSVKHYLARERGRRRALKRGGHLLQINLEDAEGQVAGAGLTPEQAFHLSCVEQLLAKVRKKLAEEYQRSNKGSLYEMLEKTLTGPEPYALLAEELERRAGIKKSVGAVAVDVCRLRNRYRELVREELALTGQTPDEVTALLRDLCSV